MLAMKSIWTAGLAGAIALGSAGRALAQQPAPAVDGGKRVIELPVKNIIATTAQPRAKPAPTAAELEAIRKALTATLDVRKGEIELPTKKVIAGGSPVDSPKAAVEAKNAVGDILSKHGFATPKAPAAKSPGANAPGSPTADNPKVEPGKVRWHASFDAARAAAARSGKPVLLFQMLGKLDDQFC